MKLARLKEIPTSKLPPKSNQTQSDAPVAGISPFGVLFAVAVPPVCLAGVGVGVKVFCVTVGVGVGVVTDIEGKKALNLCRSAPAIRLLVSITIIKKIMPRKIRINLLDDIGL